MVQISVSLAFLSRLPGFLQPRLMLSTGKQSLAEEQHSSVTLGRVLRRQKGELAGEGAEET